MNLTLNVFKYFKTFVTSMLYRLYKYRLTLAVGLYPPNVYVTVLFFSNKCSLTVFCKTSLRIQFVVSDKLISLIGKSCNNYLIYSICAINLFTVLNKYDINEFSYIEK